MTKPRINIHISREAERLLERAAGPGVTKTSLVDAAIKTLLGPKDDKNEVAAIVSRLDRMTRQMERLADDAAAQTETLALYVLYYLCITPPLPEEARAGAEALGRQRFDHFITQVGDRLLGKERYVETLLSQMGLEAPRPQIAEERAETVQ
jgi:hypothetical protein